MGRNWVFNVSHLVVLTLLLSQTGRAQSDPNKFRFEHITVNEGLSHSDAMAVAQDQHGFIWVGTNKGIDRYDGYVLKRYLLPSNDQTGSVSNRIRSLHVSSGGIIWAGAENTGLYWYNPAQDRFVGIADAPLPPASRPLARRLSQTGVQAIASDAQGRLWIGTIQHGVFLLTTDTQGRPATLRQVQVAPVNGRTDRTNAYEVFELAVDRQQRVWIGTIGGGLWTFAAKGVTPVGEPLTASRVTTLPSANIRALHLDRRGDLWVATDQRIYWRPRQHPNELPTPDFIPLQRSFSRLECLWMDSFDRLWIGTNYGLFMYEADPQATQAPPVAQASVHSFLPHDTDPFSLNSGRIHQLLEDRFHNLWLATSAGGLAKINLLPKPFGHLRRQVSGSPTLSNNYINAICKDEKNNRLWIGTRNGFSSYDLTTKTYHDYLNLPLISDSPDVDVSALFLAKDGTLWIGTRQRGLFTLKQSNGRPVLTRQPDLPGQSWSQLGLESIVEDRFGTIWVATFNAGLYRLSGAGKFIAAYSTNRKTLPTSSLTFLLYEPEQDVLWASSADKGLLKLQVRPDTLLLTKTFGHEPHSRNGLRSTYTWPLLRDRQGTLWIGTIGGGLHRLVRNKQGQEVVESCAHWLPETDIESLLADDSGNLWVGGGGLYNLDPATQRYLHYDVADGLQSNAFKVGAACRAIDGTMYLGGTNGITYFHPQKFTANTRPPVVQLTGLRIMNRSVAVGETINERVLLNRSLTHPHPIRLKAGENDFSIEFVGLNYVNPRKSQYAYQLEGYNTDWVQTAPGQRSASFANLPAGAYTFRVKVCNGDGIWSANVATLPITIMPPWWRTVWAYLVYGLVVIGSLAFYRRIITARRELENRLALEKFKVEKEKEVTDLKLNFFTNVSHELRTPLTLIIGPMEELMASADGLNGHKEKVGLMHKQTRKLFELVNQLLDFRKVESGHVTLRARRGDIVGFLTEIFLIFKLKADENRIDFIIDTPAQAVSVYFDRSKLESIITNLLSNAFKYTNEGGIVRLSVSIVGSPDQPALFDQETLVDNFVEISVFNQCAGLKFDELEKIFDPYYQASQTESLRVRGTGIGLSLVKQLVNRHRGEVTVKSRLRTANRSGDVTFTLRFPFGQAHLSPLDIQETAPAPVDMVTAVLDTPVPALPDLASLITLTANAPRILIVEDNDEVRQYLQQLFEPTFGVILAADGLEGWEKAQSLLPDLVLSDIMMPRSDGLELCRKIKQHARTLHIPVVLLTARAAVVHELEGLEMGGDDYIAKPFNPQLLYAKVMAIVQNRFKLREYYQRHILLEPTEVIIPDADRLFLEKAMKIVEANLTEPDFNVQSLVREMGVSQSAFYRRIKSITGQSAVEFIRDVRLKRAAWLLSTTSLRVSEVALQVGLEDVKYFRQMFHKLYGQSPSHYGKQQSMLVKME